MKRLWIGLIVLAVLLGGSLAIHFSLEQIHRPIAEDLLEASRLAMDEQWPQAVALARQANSRWEKYHRVTAAFADHTPMDEMDALLEELEVYAAFLENPHFSATCAHLYHVALAIADSHSLHWWNFL